MVNTEDVFVFDTDNIPISSHLSEDDKGEITVYSIAYMPVQGVPVWKEEGEWARCSGKGYRGGLNGIEYHNKRVELVHKVENELRKIISRHYEARL